MRGGLVMVYGEREGLETERMGQREGYAVGSCWGKGVDVGFTKASAEEISWTVDMFVLVYLQISAIRAKIARFNLISTGDKISGPPRPLCHQHKRLHRCKFKKWHITIITSKQRLQLLRCIAKDLRPLPRTPIRTPPSLPLNIQFSHPPRPLST